MADSIVVEVIDSWAAEVADSMVVVVVVVDNRDVEIFYSTFVDVSHRMIFVVVDRRLVVEFGMD